jgi:hypothetical protein
MEHSLPRLSAVVAVVFFSDEPRWLSDWYLQQFELKEVFSSPSFIGLAAHGVTLFIQRSSEGHSPGQGGVRPHFLVNDIRRLVSRLVDAGGRIALDVTDTGGEWVAAVCDPHGNAIGLLERKVA